jgi:hypothetical protein
VAICFATVHTLVTRFLTAKTRIRFQCNHVTCVWSLWLRDKILHPIFHGSHCFTNTQINLLLPRKNNSTISFTWFYLASQYQNLIQKDFLYKNLTGMSLPKSNEGRFALYDFIRHVNTKIFWRKICCIIFYQACQYKNLTWEDFLYRILSDMSIQNIW